MADIPNVNPDSRAATVMDAPDRMVKVRELFGIDSDMEVPAFSEADERVPDHDPAYVFDPDTTLAICAGFAKNRRVMIQGYHGTGKSTHIEQIAARLNWPTIRINLDADRRALRVRYAELVRLYHPDHNGGDRSHEKALQAVIEAYTALKGRPVFA